MAKNELISLLTEIRDGIRSLTESNKTFAEINDQIGTKEAMKICKCRAVATLNKYALLYPEIRNGRSLYKRSKIVAMLKDKEFSNKVKNFNAVYRQTFSRKKAAQQCGAAIR